MTITDQTSTWVPPYTPQDSTWVPPYTPQDECTCDRCDHCGGRITRPYRRSRYWVSPYWVYNEADSVSSSVVTVSDDVQRSYTDYVTPTTEDFPITWSDPYREFDEYRNGC